MLKNPIAEKFDILILLVIRFLSQKLQLEVDLIPANWLISVAVNSVPKDAFNFETISSVVILIVNGT